MKGDEPQLREFFGLAGFDPSRDLRELVLAIYSRPGMADRSLLVARKTSAVAACVSNSSRLYPSRTFLALTY